MSTCSQCRVWHGRPFGGVGIMMRKSSLLGKMAARSVVYNDLLIIAYTCCQHESIACCRVNIYVLEVDWLL